MLPDQTIPDNDETGATIELTVPEDTRGSVSVTFVYSHEDLSQVKVSLISPTGGDDP